MHEATKKSIMSADEPRKQPHLKHFNVAYTPLISPLYCFTPFANTRKLLRQKWQERKGQRKRSKEHADEALGK
jgi:hypothetical protein